MNVPSVRMIQLQLHAVLFPQVLFSGARWMLWALAVAFVALQDFGASENDFRVENVETRHFGQLRRLSSFSQSTGFTPIYQERTCTSGQVCSLVEISGSKATFLVTQSTCGDVSDVSAGSNFLLPATPATGSLLTVAGGEYRLCWCADVDNHCSNLTDYSIDIGRISIHGPSPLFQDQTCVAGQPCSLNISSVGIGDSSGLTERLVVQETCGDETPAARRSPLGWPNSGVSLAVEVVEVVEGEAVEGLSLTKVSTFSWGDVKVSSAGGIYRLCWCSSSAGPGCSNGEDFRVDVGAITLIGPGPLRNSDGSLAHAFQQRTCISGQSCEIHGLTGTYLSEQDSFMVLNTCGHHAPVPRFSNGVVSVTRSGATVRFGTVTAAGGLYHLCWCSAQRCSLGSDFEVTAAKLLILGPEPLEQDRTCVSGYQCSFFISSVVSDFDTVAVLETCGHSRHSGLTDQVTDRFSVEFPDGLVSSSMSSEGLAGTGSGTSGSFGSFFTWSGNESPGRLYRLCWCYSASSCSTADDFRTDLGALHVVGPRAGHQHTCVSGQICRIFGLSGQYLSEDNVYAVHDTCGVRTVPRFPQSGSSVTGAHGASVSWGPAMSAAGGNLAIRHAMAPS